MRGSGSLRASWCAFLSVDYRLSPGLPFPAAVENVFAAVEWAAEHSDAVSGDGWVAVAGDSAGETLAAVVALMAAERVGPEVEYQVLLCPGVGVEEGQASLEEHAGIVLDVADIEWFRDCYFGSEVHQRNPYADPTAASDVSGVPPATVVTAGFDPLRDGGKAYADKLEADGVSVRYRNYEAMVHGFLTLRGGGHGAGGCRGGWWKSGRGIWVNTCWSARLAMVRFVLLIGNAVDNRQPPPPSVEIRKSKHIRIA